MRATGAVLLIALTAGCAFPLSLAPYNLWFLGLVSIAVLVTLVERASVRVAFAAGYLYGVGMYGVGISWIYVSIHEHGGASPALAVFLVGVFVSFMAIFPALQMLVFARWFRVGDRATLIAFPSLWVAQEWLRTWLFSGFPWLVAGYAYLDHPLRHWAPLFGVLGVSFIAVFTAAALALVARDLRAETRSRGLRFAVVAALLVLWPGAWLAGAVEWVRPEGPARSVGMVQGNVPQEEKWKPAMRAPLQAMYREYALALEGSDLIVWPEAAITVPLEAAGPFLDPLAKWARARGTTIVTGILSRDATGQGFHNSVVALGAGHGLYSKRHLVPFGEYVPFEDLLRGLIGFFDLPMSHTIPGADVQPPLRAKDLTLSTSVCYEVVYPELVRTSVMQPDLLLTVSNDTWFGASIGPLQHMQMARMRAVENGRYLIRATNNGVSAIIDADGRIVATMPQFRRGVVTGEVRVMRGATPYSRWGCWPVVLMCFAALAGVIWIRGRRGRVSAPGSIG